ncbi:alpha/beta fold hydrolase [Chelativorans alearense]|uniref:alpha/beta fold hydrolase n=1 Tax=Chelativorans alearense TaxID=2681495 RepID=UPI001FE767BF|nr:alpha/beta fold hydrolase [Chelativorans alearense]
MSQPTLVLVPGLLCDSFAWHKQAEVFDKDMPVSIADVSAGLSITGMAEDILFRHPGALWVAGHSMGARIALEMVRLSPERVAKLALIDTGIHPRRKGEEIKRQEMVDLAHSEGMSALAVRWLPPMVDEAHHGDQVLMGGLTEMVLRANPEQHERQIEALLGRPDAAAYLGTITCPVLLAVGRYDKWSPVAQHEEMLALLPDARLVIIEDAGHFAPLEQPEAVTAAMGMWMAGWQKEDKMPDTSEVDKQALPETPLFDREANLRGYRMNKMAMDLGRAENREAFKADEDAYLGRYGLSDEEKAAVKARDWHEMVRLGGNLFFILKISAIDPTPMSRIGAAQAGMDHDAFLAQRLGKV